MQELIVLSHEDFLDLKSELRAVGLDLCYTAQAVRPLRLRWSPERLYDLAVRAQVAQRRPADPSFRVASLQRRTPGHWLWPSALTVTFHAVSPRQDAAFTQYLERRQLAPSVMPAGASGVAEAHPPAATGTYVLVALILALVTAFEVAVLYLPAPLRPPRWALMMVLTLLSVMKFGIVVSFFMHLRYDHLLYSGLFLGGLALAIGTILALLALFREPVRAHVTAPTSLVVVSHPRGLTSVGFPST